MKLLKKLIFFCFIFTTISCHASDKVEDWVKKAYPDVVDVQEVSIGNIGSVEHIAAVIYNDQQEAGIVLLKRNDSKQLGLVAKSGWWFVHSRWHNQTTSINKESVFFNLQGSGGCCSDYFTQYQFKQLNGKFVLVGTESYDLGVMGDDFTYAYKSGTSDNYLNSKRKEYRVERKACEGSKYDFLNCKTKKKLTKETFKSIPSRKLTPLDEFNVWSEAEKP